MALRDELMIMFCNDYDLSSGRWLMLPGSQAKGRLGRITSLGRFKHNQPIEKLIVRKRDTRYPEP